MNILKGVFILFAFFFSSTTMFGQFCFGSRTDFPTNGLTPRQIITTDFNLDNKPDLIVASTGNKSLSFLIGSGTGSFSVGSTFTLVGSPGSLTSDDFNNDGKPDVATVNGNSVQIVFGDGISGCTSHTVFQIGTQPVFIVSADFNHDSNFDLAIAHYGGSSISILTGNGDGSFNTPVVYGVGSSPVSIIIKDFNNDSESDLAVANNGSNDVTILLGSSNGSFVVGSTVPVGNMPSSLTSFDANLDSKMDLMVSNYADGNISILIGNGTGSFVSTSTINVVTPSSLCNADLNGDGKGDLISANNYGGISFYLGNGTGGFGSTNTLTAPTSVVSIISRDFNGDLIPDIATANSNPFTSSIFLNCFGVGIKEESLANLTRQVYPNPVRDRINIEGFEKIKLVRLSDDLGNVILELVDSPNEIEIDRFAKGIYFLEVQTESKNQFFKILKE
jgi:hypothetical protein